jgi:hypothetical protein
LTAGRIARILVVGAGAIFLGFQVVQADAVGALSEDNPFAAAAFAPDHPQVKMDRAMAEITLAGGRVSDPSEQAAVAALRHSTLAAEPFFLEGLRALAAGNPVRGEALLTEARHRNPRLRLARLLLTDRYLKTGRPELAGTEIAALARLMPDISDMLAPALAKMAHDPGSAASLARILDRDPGLHRAVLGQLSTEGVGPELILRVADARLRHPAAADSAWQSLLLGRLVDAGDLGGAYRLWTRFAGAQPSDSKGLYDGRFAGLPGPTPFNWQLADGAEGVAERASGAKLQVDYYGRADATLARQLLMLRPGVYRLQFEVGGAARGEGSQIAWTLSCISKPPLLNFPLKGVASAPRRLAVQFTIPAGCPGQWLALIGRPGDVASEQSATISALQLTSAEGR